MVMRRQKLKGCDSGHDLDPIYKLSNNDPVVKSPVLNNSDLTFPPTSVSTAPSLRSDTYSLPTTPFPTTPEFPLRLCLHEVVRH